MNPTTARPAPPEEDKRRAIRAALELCRRDGYSKLTMAAVAAASGVTAETLAGLWPSLSALVIDAFRSEIAPRLAYQFSNDFAADLRQQLVTIARLFASPDFGPHLSDLIAAAQRDSTVAAAFLERVYQPNRTAAHHRFAQAQRDGQLGPGIDLDLAVDLTFAPLWFRLLLGTGQITDDYAARIADLALAGLAPRSLTPADP